MGLTHNYLDNLFAKAAQITTGQDVVTTTQGQVEGARFVTGGTGEPMELPEEGTENIEFEKHSKADGEEEAASGSGRS